MYVSRICNVKKITADCHVQRLIWMCLKSWSLTSLRFSYKWALSLFGGSSRGAATGIPTMLVRRDTSTNTERGASGGTHMERREEGDTRLASQISRINPSDQWGDRCRSQIALTSIRSRRVAYLYTSLCAYSFQSRFYNIVIFYFFVMCLHRFKMIK